MANIISYNYDRIIAEKPHYAGRISKEFLSFNGTKYTEGVKGIANAYIPCGDHYLIINEKNALYAMLLQTSIELEISNPYFSNPLRNFDKCVQLLMPYDLEADCVSSRFYRGILRGAGIKDDTRNALNSKAFKDLFQYELTSRYECVNEELGGHYEESYIAAVGAELFQEIMDEEEEKSGGKLTMTDFMRALIQEKCANILRSQYGWEFRYREYDDIVVNEDMMFMVRLAFPELAALVDEARNTIVNGEGFGPALGMKIMQSEDTNPIAHSEIYKAAKRRGLQQIEEMIMLKRRRLATSSVIEMKIFATMYLRTPMSILLFMSFYLRQMINAALSLRNILSNEIFTKLLSVFVISRCVGTTTISQSIYKRFN